MPMLRRTLAHHRDVRTGMRAEVPADHRAPRDQDRYVMIEIALSTTTQRRPFLPFLPLTVSQRRPRSVDDAAPTSCDRRRHGEPHPNAGGACSPRPINPSKCRVAVIPTSRKQTIALLKSPYIAAANPSPFRPAISCLGASRTPVVEARGRFCDAGVRETCTEAVIPRDLCDDPQGINRGGKVYR